MKRSSLLILLFPLAVCHLGCDDSSTDVLVPRNFAEATHLFSGEEWELTYAFVADTVVDLSRYAPFGMELNDTAISGSDGCNRYWARFEIDNDSVLIPMVMYTLAGCPGSRQIDPCLFANHWKVMVTPTKLIFISMLRVLSFELRDRFGERIGALQPNKSLKLTPNRARSTDEYSGSV